MKRTPAPKYRLYLSGAPFPDGHFARGIADAIAEMSMQITARVAVRDWDYLLPTLKQVTQSDIKPDKPFYVCTPDKRIIARIELMTDIEDD